jgi:uncharacterized protein CbrC (UPF0167 family)
MAPVSQHAMLTPMNTNLPAFKYHPDPLATGSVIASDAVCECCKSARGFIYSGPVYGEEEPEDLCPWCIADGSAHARFDVSFTDEAGIGGYGDWDTVPQVVIETVAYRTPGFNGWQQERWWTHCGDAAEFLGPVGRKEMEAIGEAAFAALRDNGELPNGWPLNEFVSKLEKDRGPTAYLFRCRSCGQLGAYWDCH